MIGQFPVLGDRPLQELFSLASQNSCVLAQEFLVIWQAMGGFGFHSPHHLAAGRALQSGDGFRLRQEELAQRQADAPFVPAIGALGMNRVEKLIPQRGRGRGELQADTPDARVVSVGRRRRGGPWPV